MRFAAVALMFLWLPTPSAPPPVWPPFTVDPGSGGLPQSARARAWEQLWQQNGMDGLVSVRDLAPNGGRPVAVYLPPGLDPAKPVRTLTYFHGHDGNIGDAYLEGGVLARIKFLGSSEPNTVFICAEAGSKPFHYWMTAPRESFTKLQSMAMGEAARLAGHSLTVSARIVASHSGGGLALRNAVVAGELSCERLEYLDSNYADWGMVVADWADRLTAEHRPHIHAWDTPGSTRQHDAEVKAAHPQLIDVEPSPVNHFAIPGKLLGSTLLD